MNILATASVAETSALSAIGDALSSSAPIISSGFAIVVIWLIVRVVVRGMYSGTRP